VQRKKFKSQLCSRVFPPGWKPRLHGRQDARRYTFCETLDCQPGEILEFRPETAKRKLVARG